MGGCLLNPHSRLLPHAKASMVSNGRFVLVSAGTNVQMIKCASKNKMKRSGIFFFFYHFATD